MFFHELKIDPFFLVSWSATGKKQDDLITKLAHYPLTHQLLLQTDAKEAM